MARLSAAMPISRRSLLLAFAATGCGTSATAAPGLPRASSVPGGVAWIALGAAPERPVARQQDVPLLVVGTQAEWTAIVGIPLATPAGDCADPHPIRERRRAHL
jgi:hypothetical protein